MNIFFCYRPLYCKAVAQSTMYSLNLSCSATSYSICLRWRGSAGQSACLSSRLAFWRFGFCWLLASLAAAGLQLFSIFSSSCWLWLHFRFRPMIIGRHTDTQSVSYSRRLVSDLTLNRWNLIVVSWWGLAHNSLKTSASIPANNALLFHCRSTLERIAGERKNRLDYF